MRVFIIFNKKKKTPLNKHGGILLATSLFSLGSEKNEPNLRKCILGKSATPFIL